MELLWVRHGQMEVRASLAADLDTVNRLFNQEAQGGLTDVGRREARAVARHLEGRPVDAVYSSPLDRAVQTAEATAEALGLPVRVRPDLAELMTGRLAEGSAAALLLRGATAVRWLPDGLRRRALGATLIPLYFASWRAGRTEGGESPAAFRRRLEGVLRALWEAHGPDARVALFAHGYVIFYLAAVVAGPPRSRLAAWRRPYIPNGSITEVHYDGTDAQLVRYAATEHLR